MKSLQWALVLAANLSLSLAQTQTQTAASGTTTSARTTTTSPSSSSSSSRGPVTTTVSVGIQHAFKPDQIIAQPGDVIRFEFLPTNHSVVKADFGDPCIPYEYHHAGDPSFFSGPRLSQAGDDRPVWLLTVNDTKPVFFYCSAPESCTTWKMIGVINPNTTWSLENQLKFHDNSTKFQLSPGEPYPDEGPPLSTTTSSTAAPTSTGGAGGGSDGGGGGGGTTLSGGAIAGIAIGAAAVLIIAAALVWFCGRRGGIEKGYRKSAAITPTAPVVEAQYGNDPKSPGFSAHYLSGVPSQGAEAFRATSPSGWSSSQPVTSPHQSYLGHSGSPGIPPYGPNSPLMHGQEQQHTGSTFYDAFKQPEQPPVELPTNDNTHPSELDSRQYAGTGYQDQAQFQGQQYTDNPQAQQQQQQQPYSDHSQHQNQGQYQSQPPR